MLWAFSPINFNRFSQTPSQNQAHVIRTHSHTWGGSLHCCYFWPWMNPIFHNLHYSNEIRKSSDWESTRECHWVRGYANGLSSELSLREQTLTESESHGQSCPLDKRGPEPRAIQKGQQLDYREGSPITARPCYTCPPFRNYHYTYQYVQ